MCLPWSLLSLYHSAAFIFILFGNTEEFLKIDSTKAVARRRVEPANYNSAIWRVSLKPKLRFVYVFGVCKGNLFRFYITTAASLPGRPYMRIVYILWSLFKHPRIIEKKQVLNMPSSTYWMLLVLRFSDYYSIKSSLDPGATSSRPFFFLILLQNKLYGTLEEWYLCIIDNMFI